MIDHGIVVARRDGLMVAPDGTKYRLARGRTLADARHPAVIAYPDSFTPMHVELAYDGPEEPTDDDARQEVDGYRAQLAAIAAGLIQRDLIPDGYDTGREGWLAGLIFELLDAPAGELPVAPPRARKAATARKPSAGSDATDA